MSGKPKPPQPKKAAAPASKPPTSPRTEQKRPVKRAVAKKKAPPSETTTADDDPFEVDTLAVRRAVKVSPKPTKARTYRVVCPMCETAGYISQNSAGKDVYCCNPECMVPIYKAPLPEKEEEPEEEPKRGSGLLIGAVVIGVLVVGGVGWYALQGDQQPKVVTDPVIPDPVEEEDDGFDVQNTVVDQIQAPPATIDQIRRRSLDSIVKSAQQREKNRNSGYGTQLAVEAFAAAGELNQAQQQLKRLQRMSNAAAYYQIQPLVEIALQELNQGKTAAAQDAASKALKQAVRMPKSVRQTLDAATTLSALLVVLEQSDDAEQLIRKNQEFGPRGRLSTLWRAALDSQSFDFELEALRPYHISIPEPLRLGVIQTLVGWNRISEALAFAESTQNVAARDACRAAWAGRVADLTPETATAVIQQALASVSATGQTRAWAALASHRISSGDQSGGEAALAQAVAALGQIEPPKPADLPSMKKIYDSEGKHHAGLPNPAPWQSAMLAAADVAFVQLQIGQNAEAVETLNLSMAYAQAMTPSPAATQAIFDECNNQGAAVKYRLGDRLRLGGNDAAIRQAFNRYRGQCEKLNGEAAKRFAIQLDLLREFALRGQYQPVWNRLLERAQNPDINLQEPYFDTSLPGLVLELATANQEPELAATIRSTFQDKSLKRVGDLDRMFVKSSWLMDHDQIDQAAETVDQIFDQKVSNLKAFETDTLALRLAARVQRTRKIADTYAFIFGMGDATTKEDAFLLLGAYSVKHGTSAELWRIQAEARDLQALEHVSLYRGYIAGSASAVADTGQSAAPEVVGAE